MMKNLKRFMTSAAISFAVLLPAAIPMSARAVDQAKIVPGTTEYVTEMRDVLPVQDPGAYTGSLQLTVSQSGVVRGWYRPEGGDIESVSGGETDGRIWFSIGDQGRLRVTGTVFGDHIVGNVITSGQAFSSLSFTAHANTR